MDIPTQHISYEILDPTGNTNKKDDIRKKFHNESHERAVIALRSIPAVTRKQKPEGSVAQ